MTHNLRVGLDTAAEAPLAKPGLRPGLTPEEVREILLVAMHGGTYHTLTAMGGLDADAVAAWIKRYDRRMLLA
jgi:alkylhydroperoxidase/carboxymuconolactone decarboxylase family protein YurZ